MQNANWQAEARVWTGRRILWISLTAALLASLTLMGRRSDPMGDVSSGAVYTGELSSKVFLMNLDKARIRVEGEPFDFRARPMVSVRQSLMKKGAAVRRAFRLWEANELRFLDVLAPGASLETGLGFSDEAGDPTPFQVEILAVSEAGEESVVWEGEVVAPREDAASSWLEIREDLPYSKGDLVVRVQGEGSRFHSPAFLNPVVARPELRPPLRTNHRNVVIFLIDTLRADHLQTYGYSRRTSPHIAALAEESLVFEQANAAASWTKASVASLFTSRYPSMHGADSYTDRISDKAVTVAGLFTEAGYRTCAAGYNTWIFSVNSNITKGFEKVIEVVDQVREGGARADSVVDEAMDWIDANRETPFFAYVHTLDPHAPYVPEEQCRSDFSRGNYQGPVNGRLEGEGAFVKADRRDITREDLDHLEDLYDAEIAFLDEELGRLVSYLKRSGIWDETTFIVTADHGEEFMDHKSWSHGGTLFQEQLHVPLLVKLPRSLDIEPMRISEPVSLLDVAPTICHLAGVRTQGTPMLGQNLIALAAAPELWKRRPILAELDKEGLRMVSIRMGDRKYIRGLTPRDNELLFDLARDPGEKKNLLRSADEQELAWFRELTKAHLDSVVNPGIVIEVFTTEASDTAQVVVESHDPIDFNFIDAERGQETFRTRELGETKRWIFQFELGGEDRRDGILLRPTPGQKLVVDFGVLGSEERVLLGPEETSAGLRRMSVREDDVRLWSEEPLPWSGPSGTWIRMWHFRPSTMELTEGEKLALQDLGYLGGDD